MMTAWVIICAHLEQTKRDLRLITDREMPDWVDAVIYGTVLIFWSFTAVQMIFEYLPPGFFFGLRAQTQTLLPTPLTPNPRAQAPSSPTARCRSRPSSIWAGTSCLKYTPIATHQPLAVPIVRLRFVLLNVVAVSPEDGGAEGALRDSAGER